MTPRSAPAAVPVPRSVRDLVVVLGDQLDEDSSAFDDFDDEQDLVWMCEASGEADAVWSHKARIAVFLSAMRHFAENLRTAGRPLRYRALDVAGDADLLEALAQDIRALQPRRVVVVEPGEWRLAEGVVAVASATGVELDVRADRHFLCSRAEFSAWVSQRTSPRMENFYRWMRRRTGYLMDGGQPVSGRWNFDEENRGSFGADGPGLLVAPVAFPPDSITTAVLRFVEEHFPDHPGSLRHFDWPLTRADALTTLADFVEHRLSDFGTYQDAMASGVPWPETVLLHSRLSVALNLKLLDPREVCEAAIVAHHQARAPLASVEGFVRQVLGWREYVRGIYWSAMPGLESANALDAHEPLPGFYWNGATDMTCLHRTITETLEHGYAHHIQRLMVTGLFGLLLGVDPAALHRWYLAVYVDAVEWVEMPNTVGMSQYADGGHLASKPYVATGRYLQRMSDYCGECRFRPELATGEDACPFTTLYWDFLARHEDRFAHHPRMALQIRNLARKEPGELLEIRVRAEELRTAIRRSAQESDSPR